MLGYKEVWDSCLKIIKDNINEDGYKAFFEKITPLKLEGSTLTLQVSSYFIYEYLEEHYIDLLRKTIRKELGPDAKLEYSVMVAGEAQRPVEPESKVIPRNKPIPLPSSLDKQVNKFNPFIMPGLPSLEIDPQLNPKYTFENYIEGDCNKLARNAGVAIAQDPGVTSFNPLFIHGNTGFGKTHLAQAIGLEVKKLHPEKVVVYVNANQFKQQYTSAAIQKNETNNFLHFYQMVDVLILDDVHDFAGQTKTQDTFFNIFDQLHRQKKQIILTSDKSPVEIEGLEPRILSRFKWGLTAELTAPDYETRLAIYKRKVYKDGIDLSDEVIEYLAEKVSTNVREFEGVLNRLLAEATFNKKAISMDMVVSVVNKNIKNTQRELTVDYIYKTVCGYFNITADSAQSKTRKREIVQARQIAMYFSKSLTKTSLASIGAQIGGKNHATVLHACKQVNNLIETDRSYSDMISSIDKKLRTI